MSEAAPASTINVNTVGGFVRKAVTSSLGAKVVMAATGLIFYGWLIAHLLGNLGVFLGAETENHYAHFLKGNPEILWAQRVAWLIIFPIHFISGLRLAALNRAARPQAYASRRNWRQATWASRTMAISGLVVLAFFVFHIAHFTWGGIFNDYFADQHRVKDVADVYGMVVHAFKIPWIAAIYIVGVTLVGVHLSHGIWSGVQSLGLNGPRWTPFAKKAGLVLAILLAAGFISIPLSIVTGALHTEEAQSVSEVSSSHTTPSVQMRP